MGPKVEDSSDPYGEKTENTLTQKYRIVATKGQGPAAREVAPASPPQAAPGAEILHEDANTFLLRFVDPRTKQVTAKRYRQEQKAQVMEALRRSGVR